jgi:dipeptidyl aminopeptidase/acylaminoacyl peptidase
MRRLLSFILLLCTTAPLLAQAKHPFTFDDMMKLKRVGEPEVSPDGKWVLFSVVDVSLEANTKTPHIWIVPTAGGEEREIVGDQDADRPRWAPGGKRFAFLSSKTNGQQVWIADFDGTNGSVKGVFQFTNIAMGADGELWSPDGKNILFTSDVYPECDSKADEIACNVKKLEDVSKSKVKALVFDRLLYRHWNAYKEGKRTHIFVTPSLFTPGIEAAPLDLTPGDYDAPVFSLGGQDDYAFSPDGQEICYTSNHDKNEAASTNNDLWIVPITGGPAKNITADNPASDSTPLYSPDGKYIAYRAQQRPGYESDRFRLMLYDRKSVEKKNLTEDFDRWVGSYVWSPTSNLIYFSAEDKGSSPIFAVGVDDGPPRLQVNGSDDDLSVTPDGRTLVYSTMKADAPSAIFSAPSSCSLPSTGRAQAHQKPMSGDRECHAVSATALTHLNDAVLSGVEMSPLESFWFTGAYDDKVQGFLVKPPNFDPSKKYPLKFVIHGGPEVPMGNQWSYRWNSELFAASGYVVIFINFHGSPGYGQKFIDAINGDWGGAPYEDLMKGLDYAEKTYPFIDKDRECALGASYGGYMINWLEGHSTRFKCLVSHDGMFNAESAWGSTEELWFNNWEFKGTPYDNRQLYEKWSPHQYAKNFKTPMLVVHSQKDYRLDVSEGFQLFTTLQMQGVPSKMLYFPDEGHWILKPQNSQLWYKTVNDWIDQWTKK